VVSLAGGNPEATKEVAQKFKVRTWTTDLAESLKQPGLEAVILATRPRLHAKQAIQCTARRQARAGRDPDRRLARRLARDREGAKGHRPDRDGGTHTTLQPEPPVGAEEDPRRRAEAEAARVQTFFLPPHQHECRRQAAQLD